MLEPWQRVFAAVAAAAIGAGLGCGPTILLDETDASSDTGPATTADPPPSTTTAIPPPSTTTAEPPPSTTTAVPPPDETTTGADSDTWGGFLDGFDFAGPVTCDVFEQDCPEGDKCAAWSDDGGVQWNDARCVPILGSAQPGDACNTLGDPFSGHDTCAFGSMCWSVDPVTEEGTCVALCTGTPDDTICQDPDTLCAALGDVLALCLIVCDPLLQDCPEGEACYMTNEGFACGPDVSGDMGAPGDACESSFACDPGSICADASLVPDCLGAPGCCTSLCDIIDPMPPCLPGQTCASLDEYDPWNEMDWGVCALPM